MVGVQVQEPSVLNWCAQAPAGFRAALTGRL
jgi:hypothetical protein